MDEIMLAIAPDNPQYDSLSQSTLQACENLCITASSSQIPAEPKTEAG